MSDKYDVRVICGPEVYDKRKKFDPNNHFVLEPSIELFRVSTLDVDKNTVKGKIKSVISSSFKIAKEVKKRVKREDMVLMVTNPFPLIILMSKLKRRIGFNLSILVHDIFPENAKPSHVYIPFEKYVKRLYDSAYADADLLIALGRDMKEVLEYKVNRFEKRPRIEIIENWADTININATERSSDNIIIEYAGNIGRGQRLEPFLESFINSNNNFIHFDIYGTGALENTLKEKITKLNINNVIFHGPYFRSQQNNVLNNCDLALVILAEGLFGLGVPSKSYNIMAAGKPILYIGHPQSEIALLIKEKGIGYVYAVEDTKGLQEFLSGLNSLSLIELKEMGKRARKVAEEEYTKEIILEKFRRTI